MWVFFGCGEREEYRSRAESFLGIIGSYRSHYLHLNKGKNELILAVALDRQRLGVMGRLE